MKQIRQYFQSLDSLTVDEGGQPTSRDLLLAVGVLLAEAARASGTETPEEGREMFRGLEREFKLGADEIHKLLELSHGSLNDPAIFDQMVEDINASFSDVQKQKILAMCFKVLLADGVVKTRESVFAAQLRSRLGLTLEQSLQAARMAEGGVDLTLEESALPEAE